MQLLLAGSLSGLTSVLAHSVVWSFVMLARPALRPETAAAQPRVAEVVLHMLCGITLAFLFWLSWGLAALVGVPWWVRGVAFAGLCWLGLSLPSVLALIAAQRGSPWGAALVGSRWATTALVTGLTCAWTWEHAA